MAKIEPYREIYIKDGYRCVYCGRDMLSDFDTWMSIELDHVIPKAEGGDDSITNRVTSCNLCNKLKGAFVPEGFAKMEQQELLEEIRGWIFKESLKWRAKYYPATEQFRVEEFRRLQAQQEDD
jgi:CRISPR/Cas system Type II protein with McrA/HNH and RuvC-like nuclease domain|tara:strand:- start:598 stop:966 length:369 start_codon:yes stop_codon:yes gene_type:complete